MPLMAILTIAGLHMAFGILSPALLILLGDRRGQRPRLRSTAIAWMLLSWSFFLASIGFYILKTYVGEGIRGTVLAIVLGVVPFFLLAIIAAWQSARQLRK